MNKWSFPLILTFIFTSLGCGRTPKSVLEFHEVQEDQNKNLNDSKNLLEIMDSIASSIAAEQEIDNSKKERNEDEIEYKLIKNHRYDLKKVINSPKIKIAGHWGKEVITGNFTGIKVDTIWLEEYEFEIDNITYPMYKAKSNIPNFPEIEMYW